MTAYIDLGGVCVQCKWCGSCFGVKYEKKHKCGKTVAQKVQHRAEELMNKIVYSCPKGCTVTADIKDLRWDALMEYLEEQQR